MQGMLDDGCIMCRDEQSRGSASSADDVVQLRSRRVSHFLSQTIQSVCLERDSNPPTEAKILRGTLSELWTCPLLQASRDGLLSLSCHSSRSRILARRDSSLDFLQDSLQEHSPELRGLYLERLVGRGSFGRVYKGAARSLLPELDVCHHAITPLDLYKLRQEMHSTVVVPDAILQFRAKGCHQGLKMGYKVRTDS